MFGESLPTKAFTDNAFNLRYSLDKGWKYTAVGKTTIFTLVYDVIALATTVIPQHGFPRCLSSPNKSWRAVFGQLRLDLL